MERIALSRLRDAGAKIYLFGSRARGDFQRFSDIDLLVESERDLSQMIGEIAEALEDSDLPFKVDLVSKKDLAESYRDSVNRDKILL